MTNKATKPKKLSASMVEMLSCLDAGKHNLSYGQSFSGAYASLQPTDALSGYIRANAATAKTAIREGYVERFKTHTRDAFRGSLDGEYRISEKGREALRASLPAVQRVVYEIVLRHRPERAICVTAWDVFEETETFLLARGQGTNDPPRRVKIAGMGRLAESAEDGVRAEYNALKSRYEAEERDFERKLAAARQRLEEDLDRHRRAFEGYERAMSRWLAAATAPDAGHEEE